MNVERKHVAAAMVYAIVGMCYGMIMAASKDHTLHVAHAHILLVGFVTSFMYGATYRLWLNGHNERLASIQFWLHHLGTVVMGAGLTLLYSGVYSEDVLGPVLGLSSVAVLISAVLMLGMYVKFGMRKTWPFTTGTAALSFNVLHRT